MNISDSPYGQGKNGLTGLRPFRHSLSLPTTTSCMTRKCSVKKNNYFFFLRPTLVSYLYDTTLTGLRLSGILYPYLPLPPV